MARQIPNRPYRVFDKDNVKIGRVYAKTKVAALKRAKEEIGHNAKYVKRVVSNLG